MRVVSDATLVTGSALEPVSYPPGSEVSLPEEEARDLIARGLARPVLHSQPESQPAPPPAELQLPPDTLNLNTATAAQLAKAISGVGQKTAKDIVAHRNKALFTSLEDCAERVGGVSLAQLEAAKATV